MYEYKVGRIENNVSMYRKLTASGLETESKHIHFIVGPEQDNIAKSP